MGLEAGTPGRCTSAEKVDRDQNESAIGIHIHFERKREKRKEKGQGSEKLTRCGATSRINTWALNHKVATNPSPAVLSLTTRNLPEDLDPFRTRKALL